MDYNDKYIFSFKILSLIKGFVHNWWIHHYRNMKSDFGNYQGC